MNLTVKDAIFIAAPPEAVWDFTQDWRRRTEWDDSVLDAEILEGETPPAIRVRARGGVAPIVRWQLARVTRRMLAKAKAILERGSPVPA